MNYKSLEDLSPLDTFDKNAFVGNDQYPQELCNFVLSLSLIWNDLKNLLSLFSFMNEQIPKGIEVTKQEEMPVDPIWGEISGYKIFLEKHIVSLIHELFYLVKHSKEEIESNHFKKIFKQIRKNSKESWQTIVKYSFGQDDTSTDFGKALLMVRHKISNHFDKGEIFKGYKRKFIENDNIPYISRGSNMAGQRFYFADAAAQEYYRSHQEKMSSEEFYLNLNTLKENINFALQNIIETFIQGRSAWKKVNS